VPKPKRKYKPRPLLTRPDFRAADGGIIDVDVTQTMIDRAMGFFNHEDRTRYKTPKPLQRNMDGRKLFPYTRTRVQAATRPKYFSYHHKSKLILQL